MDNQTEMKLPPVPDQTEDGYFLFTPESHTKLRQRKKEIKEKKASEKNSAAKQAILKGLNEKFMPEAIDSYLEPELEPDQALEDGQELPQYYGHFPKKYRNQPIEDVDPYYKHRGEETFCVVSRSYGKNYVHRFSSTRALFVLSPFNPLRQIAIKTLVHPAFDAIVLLAILVNCAFLSLDNEIKEAEYFFTAFYTVEMIIKIAARGIILNSYTYLRDPWNCLDFFIVVVSFVTISGDLNISGLRAFRVLRALKSVSIVPGLKTIVNSLFHSLLPLAEVMLIMAFLMVVIALIALQAYQGVLRRRCVKYWTPQDNITDQNFVAYTTNQSNWRDVEGEEIICGNTTGSGFCPVDFICLPDVGPNPNFGYTNFDNMAYALLTSFQLLTLDFWENVYNMIIRAEGPWNILFFLLSVFLGPFYLLNLLLAVVTLAYGREHDKQELLEELRIKAKERAKRKRIRKRKIDEEKARREVQALEEGSAAVSIGTLDFVKNSTSSMGQKQVIINEYAPGENHTDDITQGDVESSVVRNGAPKAKTNPFKNGRKQVSVDSSESSNKVKNKWLRKLQRAKLWYMNTFCSWSCTPGFVKFQEALQKVINHKFFEGLVMTCILLNTVFLAIDHHGISIDLENALNIANKVFTAIFTFEALFKIVALGPLTYGKEPWNKFDFFIVLSSLVELALDVAQVGADVGFTVLRTFRLLRVLRLAKMWGTMRKLVSIIMKSLGAVRDLTLVLFLVLFIFAVLGNKLLSQNYRNSAHLFDDNQIPRWNFVDFFHSFVLVWRVMCGEWIEPLYDCLYITEGTENIGFCIPLFLLITFFANFMILNLFTAILLDAFNIDNIKAKKDKDKQDKNKVEGNNVNNADGGSNGNDVAVVVTEQPISEKKNEPELDGLSIPRRNRRGSWINMIGLGQNSPTLRLAPTLHTVNEVPQQTQQTETVQRKPGRRKTFNRQNSVRDIYDDNVDLITKHPPIIIEPIAEEYEETPAGEEVIVDTTPKIENLEELRQIQSVLNIQDSGYSKTTNPFLLCGGMMSCCDCVQGREETASNSNADDNNEAQENEEEEEKKEIPPNSLPEWFLNRYPKFRESPDTPVGKCWHQFRTGCYKLVEHKYFEGFVLFLIVASTTCLAMEDVYLQFDPVRKEVLLILEYIFTVLFTIEMILKLIGFGPTKYFTSFCCLLDGGIVAASWAGIIIQLTSANPQSSNTAAFRALRTLRALRPLRAISRWQGMRVVVNALIYCIPSIGNVLCVCSLIWLIFAILGVQFFKGKFFRCLDGDDALVTSINVTDINTCIDAGYFWVNTNVNFDNVANAMLALFQVATYEGWIELMASASDTTAVDLQPRREANQYLAMIYFIIFVLVGAFFILNLIVGVIIESFQKLRKQTDASSAVEALLTDTQKNFYKTMRTMLNRKPKKTISPPNNKLQLFFYNIVTHNRFELVIFILIVLNMITLSMEHYQMTQEWVDALRVADITFTALFGLEALMKLMGMRHYYFKDAFNVFDFVVIVVSITGFILEKLIAFIVSPTLLRVVRVFRVFRVLRVVRAARGIRRLILTLMISLPALFNIAILLGVFIVIYAILGMNLFMNVKFNESLNDQVNFQTFGNSILLLFRLVTSAGWNDVLDPLMNTRNCTSVCVAPDCVVDCGDPFLAAVYFLSFIFIVFLVIVNMYIAIILENFDEIFKQDESGVSQGDFETFYMVWGRYDPRATQFVTLTELSNLLHDLHPPFQLPKPNLVKIGALDLPVLYGDKVHCLDVLFALVKRILGEVEISEEMRKEAEERLLKSFPTRRTLKAETTTLVLRQQMRAAKLIQDNWKCFQQRKREKERPDMATSILQAHKMHKAIDEKSKKTENGIVYFEDNHNLEIQTIENEEEEKGNNQNNNSNTTEPNPHNKKLLQPNDSLDYVIENIYIPSNDNHNYNQISEVRKDDSDGKKDKSVIISNTKVGTFSAQKPNQQVVEVNQEQQKVPFNIESSSTANKTAGNKTLNRPATSSGINRPNAQEFERQTMARPNTSMATKPNQDPMKIPETKGPVYGKVKVNNLLQQPSENGFLKKDVRSLKL